MATAWHNGESWVLCVMLDLELLAKRNNYLKSRHFLDYFQFDSTEKLDNPDSESDSEDYADKRLYQGKFLGILNLNLNLNLN